MVKLSGLVELTSADCNIGGQWSVSRGNGRIKRVEWNGWTKYSKKHFGNRFTPETYLYILRIWKKSSLGFFA